MADEINLCNWIIHNGGSKFIDRSIGFCIPLWSHRHHEQQQSVSNNGKNNNRNKNNPLTITIALEVEKYQGKEKDCLFVLMVRTVNPIANGTEERKRIGVGQIFGDWSRLIGEITWAKTRLMFVGGTQTMKESNFHFLKQLVYYFSSLRND